MRKYLNGGYYTLNLEEGTTNYQDLLQSIKNGKAIMIKLYDNVYFADSVAFDEDTESIILTKGGKTITVDIYGDVNDEGEIVKHLYQYIFSASCSDSKDWFFRCLSSQNVNTLEELLNLLSNNSSLVASIEAQDEEYSVKLIDAIYFNGEEDVTEMLVDELYSRDQNMGFAVADAEWRSKKQLF